VADRELDRDLALARQALRAPEAMKARVRSRLAAGAGLPPKGGLPPSASEPRRHTELPVPERPLRGLKRRPGLGTVTLLLGLSFGAGFWLGRHPNTGSPGQDPPGATARTQPPEGEVAPAAARPEASPPAPENPALAPAAAPRAAKPKRARSAAPAPAAGVLRESSWRGSAEGREGDALAAEVALLERTERAIRKGDAALALGLLAELDEKFPAAALPEERQAARVLASCAHEVSNGDSRDASALAGRFLAENPASVYAARIRQACAALPSPIGGVRLQELTPGGH
jgi:hypothetical protein